MLFLNFKSFFWLVVFLFGFLKALLMICVVAVEKVSLELDRHFPTYEVLNALGILYPQYWLSEECLETFPHHLEIITSKRFFCEPKELLLPNGLK